MTMRAFFALFLIFLGTGALADYFEDAGRQWPTLMISILARNKAHTLPYFLALLDRQDYPKDRIALWVRSDHNGDKTVDILNLWLSEKSHLYHSTNLRLGENDGKNLPLEEGLGDWPDSRFHHVISLRENALDFARRFWVDYLFMVDADVFLSDPNTLKNLVSMQFSIVSPMLRSDGLYSNFWGGMAANYYYERSDDYTDILYGNNVSCFEVPMVHSAVLIDLQTISSKSLTYDPNNLTNYGLPLDDIIAFAISAKKSGTPIHVCNDKTYGYLMVPLSKSDTLEKDHAQLLNLKVESAYGDHLIETDPLFSNYVRHITIDKMNLDQIYMINLERRPNRRAVMKKSIDQLGLEVKWVNAVDGKKLDDDELEQWGIQLMPNYLDPYLKRPITMGEIGCFLSHYIIWKDIIQEGHQKVMVLEDDVHFQPYFRHKLALIMEEIEQFHLEWDLIYLGRKLMGNDKEPNVSPSLVKADYSYWTLGYLLSNNGAKKLVDGNPLSKLLPVDEYLPIMFDKQPETSWSDHYHTRDLIAYSVQPLMIYPTHYKGEDGYISDTENSLKIDDEFKESVKEEL